jgi:hypothetical protein
MTTTTTTMTKAAKAELQERLKEFISVEAVDLELLKTGTTAWSGEYERSRLLRHGATLHFDAVFIFLKAKGETEVNAIARAAASVQAWRLTHGGLLQGELTTMALAPGAGSAGSVGTEGADSVVSVKERTDAGHIWPLLPALSEAMKHTDVDSLEGFTHRLLTLQPALDTLEWYSQEQLQVYLDTIAKHIEVRVGPGKLQREPSVEDLADDAFDLACWINCKMPTVGAGTEAAAGAGGEAKLTQVSGEPAKAPVEEALESNLKAATTIKATNNNNNDTAPAAPAPVATKKAPTKKGDKKKAGKKTGKHVVKPSESDTLTLRELEDKLKEYEAAMDEGAKDKKVAAKALRLAVEGPIPKEEEKAIVAGPAKEEGALVVASVSTKAMGGKNKNNKNKGKKDKTAADPSSTKEPVTPLVATKAHPGSSTAERARKLAASKAGTHIKSKSAATRSTSASSTSTASAVVPTTPNSRTTRTRSTKAGSGGLDTLASSASGLEVTHRSTGSTGSNASSAAAAAAAVAAGPKEGDARRVAPSGAGAVLLEEQGEDIQQLASMPTSPPQQQQQQQQQQPLVADSPVAVAEDGPDNEPSQAALDASSSAPPPPTDDTASSGTSASLAVLSSLAPPPALVEAEEDGEESQGRQSFCSSLTACALGLAMKVPILGPVVSKITCAAVAVCLGPMLAESEPKYPAQAPTFGTLTFRANEREMTEAEAIQAVLELEVAEAEQAAALALTTPSSPPHSTASNADVPAAGSSNTNVDKALEPINGTVPSSPPSAPSSPPSLLARATSVVLFPAKFAVGVTVGTVKATVKTARKGAGVFKSVVVGSVKGIGRDVGVGFGVSKGLGSVVLRVLRGMGWGVRRVAMILVGGRQSEEVEGTEGEKEEGEGVMGPVVDGVGMGDGE